MQGVAETIDPAKSDDDKIVQGVVETNPENGIKADAATCDHDMIIQPRSTTAK